MPFFRYTAKNQYGEKIKGKVEARNVKQAAAELAVRQLLVIDVHPYTDDSFATIKTMLFGVKFTDIVNFTRQLSTMISAGLPLANSLSILVQQSKAEMSRLVAQILQDIEGGLTFTKALEKHPDVFSSIYVQLVHAGEVGGVLDDILGRLATNMEKTKEFRAKTRGAMIYPVIVIIAMLVVASVMMIFVIPKLSAMYDDFGAEMPLPTLVLIGISNFMVNFWWLMILIGAGAFFAFREWKKTHAGHVAFDRFLLKIPIMGDLLKKITLTEFARTLSLLLGAGISLLQALDIVTQGVDNIIYKEALQDVYKQVEKGVPMSKALSKYDDFPPILFQMMSVGEETGKLDEVLGKLANYFDQESEQAVKNLTAAIEPMIMIVLGVGVGAMVIAIILPIYNLTSQF
ncbi:MAG: pilus assembly protein PilC [Candidatus Pacebacteria bacterium CG_4_10_14_0_8_um_filter_43_12]|nr:MAG: pilus assembly protein PilC [Candidatus Pacebacteria bacterium CG_4_10_14_0_8_um_filter_43_12]